MQLPCDTQTYDMVHSSLTDEQYWSVASYYINFYWVVAMLYRFKWECVHISVFYHERKVKRPAVTWNQTNSGHLCSQYSLSCDNQTTTSCHNPLYVGTEMPPAITHPAATQYVPSELRRDALLIYVSCWPEKMTLPMERVLRLRVVEKN